MKSNLESPLGFFEYILEERNITLEINKRVIYYGFSSYAIRLPNDFTYAQEDDYGNMIEGMSTIKDQIIPFLRLEFEKSKHLLEEKYLQNTLESNGSFLTLQFNTLQSLVSNESQFLNKYPYFLFPIRGLVKFINDKLLLPNMEQFTLNEDSVDMVPVSEDLSIVKSNEEVIHSVISYMKGKNEKQVYILSEDDYQLLLNYTTYLISREQIPSITRRLKPNMQNGALMFTFWVLHKELYTSSKIREYFYDFLKDVFINLDSTSISSIRKIIGAQSRIPKYSFLPEIILNYIK